MTRRFMCSRRVRGGLMTWRTVHYVVAEAGKAAGIGFQVHPHMLRHGTGFYLANAGQDTRAIQLYLGHKNIQHAVRARPAFGLQHS
jgi:site-specific recombinase XerD